MKHEVFVISPKKESVINENEQKENFSETRNMNSEFITMEFHKNMGEITNEITTQKSKRKAAKNHELSEENAVKIMKNNLTPESQLPVDTLTPSTPASLSNNFVDLSSLRSSQLDHNIPLECPFHPMRDIFYPQESAKRQHRSSQWTCTFCGKSFYQEKYLDLHFDNRHRNKINMAEDAICLADYCDIMRCEVLQTQNEKQNDNVNSESSQQYRGSKSSPITDLEVWREPTQRTALSIVSNSIKSPSTISNENNLHSNHNLCDKSEAPQIKNQNNSQSIRKCETLVDSVVPPRQRFIELQKLKANCKTDDLLKLKLKCEGLVRDCIAGLLINLSVQDFKDIEVELNNAVCWYLTCDRYWEDTQSNPRHFSWGLIFVPVILLSLGLTLCYYIIWIFFDSNDLSPIEENTLHNYSRYQCVKQYSDEYYPASDVNPSNNHYIYVTYPPEIKRKLLDSCYNRTPRL